MNTFSPSAIRLIRMDHSQVLSKLRQYRVDLPPAAKRALARAVCLALDVHAQLMDELVVPALASTTADTAMFERRAAHQTELRHVVTQLRRLEPVDPRFDTLFMTLMQLTLRHVADDDACLLPMAESILKHELNDLGAQMVKRRFELTRPKAGELANRLGWSLPGRTLAAIGAVGLVLAVWWRIGSRSSQRRHRGGLELSSR